MAAREPEAHRLLSGAQPVDSNDPSLTKTFPMLPWVVKESIKPDGDSGGSQRRRLTVKRDDLNPTMNVFCELGRLIFLVQTHYPCELVAVFKSMTKQTAAHHHHLTHLEDRCHCAHD